MSDFKKGKTEKDTFDIILTPDSLLSFLASSLTDSDNDDLTNIMPIQINTPITSAPSSSVKFKQVQRNSAILVYILNPILSYQSPLSISTKTYIHKIYNEP